MTIRLKWVAKVIAGQAPPSDAVRELASGLPFVQGNAEFGPLHPRPLLECDLAAKVAAPGDILLSVRAPVGAINVADQLLGIGRGLAAIRTGPGHDARYVRYVVHGSISLLRSMATGTTYEAVTADDIGSLPVTRMPQEHERRIADFLDDQVARVDNVIASRSAQVALVRESVSHVLVDVAREQGATDPSPLAWFPAWRDGWTVQRLAWLVRCLDGKRVPLNGVERSHRRGEYPYYGASTIVDYVDDYLFDGEYVLVGEDGAALENPRFDVVQRVSGRIWVNNHAHVVEGVRVDADYLAHFIRCVDRPLLISGATRPKITQEDLLAMRVVVPSGDERAKLNAGCAERIDQNRRTVALLGATVDRLRELKRSLITAAVTGEFDVSSADGSQVPVP